MIHWLIDFPCRTKILSSALRFFVQLFVYDMNDIFLRHWHKFDYILMLLHSELEKTQGRKKQKKTFETFETLKQHTKLF